MGGAGELSLEDGVTMAQATCVYCRRTLPVAAFSRPDHVIPRAFGTFERNFTLIGCVCDECNQYFGDELEVELARDTFEGISRVRFKVKKASEFRGTKKAGRTTIRVAEGPFKGAFVYLEYSPETDETIVMPVPQVGVYAVGAADPEFVALEGLLADPATAREKLGPAEKLLFLGCASADVTAQLASKGINVELGATAPPPEGPAEGLLCEVVSQVDTTVQRAVAKIAFNYLTHSRGAEFVLNPACDYIARFVRFGESAPFPLVRVIERPILADEPVEGERRLGHLITTGIAPDGVSIVGQVSLFNWATYAVALAPKFGQLPDDIRSGSFFNIATRQIDPLEVRGTRLDASRREKESSG